MAVTTSSSLPLARVLDGARTGALHRRSIEVPAAVAERAEVYATAALAALVHRYTGETDLLTGRRRDPDRVEPLALRVDGGTTAAELLRTVSEAPVVTDPGTGRPAHAAVDTTGPLTRALAALTLSVTAEGFELALDGDEFDATAADQYARHLERVLAALVAEPDGAVRDIALLTDEELHRTLVEWNDTEGPVGPAFFHELVAEHARRTPDALAVILPGTRLTYRELDGRANQLAHRLTARGVRPGDRVGVCFPRSAESLIAQLACFKLACAAILLDSDFPADRVRYMVQDASAALVLTLAAHEDKVSGLAPVLALDTDDWRTEPDTEVAEPVGADDLIHICYTSGSTGAPKAVMVRFGAARNLIHSMAELTGTTGASQGTWLAAPGYGMIEVECFPVLARGGTVHIPDVSVVSSEHRLQEWFLREGITTTLLMKPMAERLWRLEWPEDTPLENIRVCGERIQSWPPAGLPFRLINLYGSAEATVVASCDITALGEELGARGRARRLPPIGRPTTNVTTYVLDEELRPLPPGLVGELCIAGVSLSAGYLGRPEATAEKWITNPIDPARHPVMYRTGDLARYWPDGSIEIVGRTDNQVKVRGNRVHLGEIEVVLTTLPGVNQAAVLAHRDSLGDVQLTAYIEPGVEAAPSVRDLRRGLAQRLPSFMVPAVYVIGGLPTSVNGKIDRAALPEPPRSRPELDTPYQAPAGALEEALLGLWTKVLELDGVGVRDNFFELGGDSLRAARLTNLVREEFPVDIEIVDLFDEPTVARMAALVADRIPAAA
ncbi:non-ribosomal peptide synthetase [Streptomyces sp. NBC_00582]|uniref:non-ribosomal peptide synthetase n=1 Tax=Streptomyces sp. NBC_00582 TaxID=2975783 RepID=UPI00106268A6|nr:amino acid adenylation domain-containing protein [Streptomyces sp. NBC_00582]WUB63953.1 amino acid adenylation domain-containing protein [Streptomyces sp. NBC_00582]